MEFPVLVLCLLLEIFAQDPNRQLFVQRKLHGRCLKILKTWATKKLPSGELTLPGEITIFSGKTHFSMENYVKLTEGMGNLARNDSL